MAGREEEVAFRVGEDRVYGTLCRPKHRGRRPLAILAHGFGSFRDELTGFVEIAGRLTASGIASLRLDMRGCGKSGRRGLMHPMYDWVDDLSAAVSFAETLDGIAADRIAVVGMSMGGGIAAIAAALDERIRVVASLAPVADGEDWFRHLWTGKAGERGWQAFRETIAEDRRRCALRGRSRIRSVGELMAYAPGDQKAFREMSRRYPEFLKRMTLSSVDSAMRVKAMPMARLVAPRPLLVVHSRADGSVPYRQGEALAAAAGPSCRLVLIDESPHCFWIGDQSVAVQEEVRGWLVRHL